MMAGFAVRRPVRLVPDTSLVLVALALLLAPFAAVAAIAMSGRSAMLPLAVIGGPLVFVLLVASPRARVLWVLVGGVLALQSSQELDLLKLAYLSGVAISAGVALIAIRRPGHAGAVAAFAPITKPSAFLVIAVALASALSLAQGTAATAVLRDVAPFLLFALMPAIAIEARSAFSTGQLRACFVLLGLLGSASFAVEWLDRRSVVELPLDRLALPSFLLPMALVSYATSAVLRGEGRRWPWELAGAFAIGAILLTGTRSGLIVFAAPMAIAFILHRQGAAAAGHLLRLLLRYVAAVTLFALSLSFVGAVDLSLPMERLMGLSGSLGSSIAGQSFRQRAAQTDEAWNRFRNNPLFGGGPGENFHWQTEFGPKEGVNLDSPLSYPAKFGLVGIAALISLLAGYARLSRQAARDRETGVAATALLGYLAVIVAAALIVSPIEDKGMSFAMLLLIAMCLPEPAGRRTSRSAR